MKAEYQITDRKDSRALARFLNREGQVLLPMLELIEQSEDDPEHAVRAGSGRLKQH